MFGINMRKAYRNNKEIVWFAIGWLLSMCVYYYANRGYDYMCLEYMRNMMPVEPTILGGLL